MADRSGPDDAGALLDVPAAAIELGERFRDAGHELYLVGGVVRDLLLRQPSPDLDLATDALPQETTRILRDWADRRYFVGVKFGTDLSRRDFTVNAMAIRVPDRTFVDPFGGVKHLAAKVLDTPLDPEVSFGDDPLRMLRAARFAARFDLQPAPRVV